MFKVAALVIFILSLCFSSLPYAQSNSVQAENALWEVYVNRDGVLSTAISGSDLWIGTAGGLEQRDIHSHQLKRLYTKLDGLPGNQIYSLLSEPSQALWIGTDQGLAYFQDGKFLSYDLEANGAWDNGVLTLLSDGQGGVWMGTTGGELAHLFKDNHWEMIREVAIDGNQERIKITTRG